MVASTCPACNHEFDRKFALVGEAPGTVHCPDCKTLVDLGAEAPGGVFCFECGVEIAAVPAALVPICDACRPS